MSIAFRAAWISILVMSLLSDSDCGDSAANSVERHTVVCSTTQGNNSSVKYNVTFSDTEVVLSCDPGDLDGVAALWTKQDGSVVCSERNCTLNQGRNLTNDDSGNYICRISAANGTEYQSVIINVLAPPKLLSNTGVIECCGEDRTTCTIGQNTYFPVSGPRFSITATFQGNGPFQVQWYLNGTKYDCAKNSNVCVRLSPDSKSITTNQTLIFKSSTMEEALMISGLYSAVVINPYGTNVSLFRLEYSCSSNIVPASHPEKIDVINLVEGFNLNSSCGLTINPSLRMVACVTKNVSTTFEDIISHDFNEICVDCDAGDIGSKCAKQFNSNLTDISVSRSRGDDCSQTQLLSFFKEKVSLDDDGTKIICAYVALTGARSFHSFYLNVSPQPSNHNTLVAALISTFSILLLAVIVVVVICIVSRRTRKHRKDMLRRPRFIIDINVADSDETSLEVAPNNETNLLLPRTRESHPQYSSMCSLSSHDLHFEGDTKHVSIG